MDNVLVRKLKGYVPLDIEDKLLLNTIVCRAKTFPAHTHLATEGHRPTSVKLILEGFACRYQSTAEGNRQITSYLVPGDFSDLDIFVFRRMDHNICTMSQCLVVEISQGEVLTLFGRSKLSLALRRATLVDAAILREWLVSVGQRRASQRLAHVLCELLLRLRTVGLAENSFELPISQADLADTIGVTTVHLNRVLQELRREKLISWKDELLVIHDIQVLMEISGFNPRYLHIGEQGTGELGGLRGRE